MKTLTNSICKGIVDEKGKAQTYAQVGILCLQSPIFDHNGNNAGFTPAEMVARIRVQDKLEKGGEVIELEDADAEKLLQCINSTKWTKLDKDILKFITETKEELTKAIPANK